MSDSATVSDNDGDLPAASQEDKELAAAFQRGEKGAYQAIHDRYGARVRGVCKRMLAHPDDAQEASQEAFLRIYQGLPRFNGRYHLGAWVTRIATNVCLDVLRQRGRHPADAELLEYEQAEPTDATDPQEVVIRNAEGRRVRRVLASLPPLHRAAIVLRDFEGLSYAEVAVSLGITDAQAKALIHRARKAFKSSWDSVVASLFIPARLLGRVRRLDRSNDPVTTMASNHAAEIVSTSAPYASACTGLLQHCGQILGERVAPVIAAALVGTAAGAAVVSSREVAPEPAPVVVDRVLAGEPHRLADVKPSKGKGTNAPGRRAPGDDGPAAHTVGPPPTPSPTPTPAPTPTPSPSGGASTDGKSPAPSSSPTPPPEPKGFTLSFTTDVAYGGEPCPCMKSTTVNSEIVAGNESGSFGVEQDVEGTVDAAGTASYGLDLHHRATHKDHEMSFFLNTTEGGYGYRATGTLVARDKTDWGGWAYSYEGTYALTAKPGSKESMPERGTYTAEVSVSWRHKAVRSTSIVLAEASE